MSELVVKVQLPGSVGAQAATAMATTEDGRQWPIPVTPKLLKRMGDFTVRYFTAADRGDGARLRLDKYAPWQPW